MHCNQQLHESHKNNNLWMVRDVSARWLWNIELFAACLLASSSWSVGTLCVSGSGCEWLYIAKVICLFERLQSVNSRRAPLLRYDKNPEGNGSKCCTLFTKGQIEIPHSQVSDQSAMTSAFIFLCTTSAVTAPDHHKCSSAGSENSKHYG